MTLRTLGLLVATLGLGCVDVEFSGTTGSTSTTGTGGSSGQGGGASTTTSSTGGAATTGTGGAAPCTPKAEVCNDLDDDCDGFVDEPDAGVGSFCGRTWGTFGGKLYAIAPTPNGTATPCPGGTSLVVLEDATEQSFVSNLVVIANGGPGTKALAYVGYTQSPSSWDRVGGWGWVGGEGMVMTWGAGQPDDYDVMEPTPIENHDEDCGAIAIDQLGGTGFADAPCGGFAQSTPYIACEAAGATCKMGDPCLVAEGCTGTFDCTKPEGQRCVAVPKNDSCNGLDDNCDGAVDSANNVSACGCTTTTSAGHTYKRCSQNQTFTNLHCGPGFRLAAPKLASEAAAVQALVQGSQSHYLGGYQLSPATVLGSGWVAVDRSTFPLMYWDAGQPNDVDGVENDAQNCLRTISAGWHDNECLQSLPYICEDVP